MTTDENRTAPHRLYNIYVFFNGIESSKKERMRRDTERVVAKFEGRRRKKRDKQSLVIYHKITSFLVFFFFFFFTKNLHKTMAFGLKINFNDMFKKSSFLS